MLGEQAGSGEVAAHHRQQLLSSIRLLWWQRAVGAQPVAPCVEQRSEELPSVGGLQWQDANTHTVVSAVGALVEELMEEAQQPATAPRQAGRGGEAFERRGNREVLLLLLPPRDTTGAHLALSPAPPPPPPPNPTVRLTPLA